MVLRRSVESAFATSVAVKDDPGDVLTAQIHRGVREVGDRLRAHVPGHGTAERPKGADVEDHR